MLLRKILLTVTVTVATAAALAAPAAASGTATRDATGSAEASASSATTAAGSAATAASTTGAAGANPVVVVAGLSGVATVYEPLAARLRADGYRAFIYQLPGLGFGDIADSARAFSGYVAQVRSTTGAAKVDLVAHSEGGLVSRYYLKNLGGTANVGRYISLGTPQYGTYVANIIAFLGLGDCIGIPACQQMTIGSTFLNALNAGDDTPGAVRYTTVRTVQDELVRPTPNATLADGASNVLIQAYCPLRVVGHVGLVLDGTAYSIVRGALADGPVRPNCLAL